MQHKEFPLKFEKNVFSRMQIFASQNGQLMLTKKFLTDLYIILQDDCSLRKVLRNRLSTMRKKLVVKNLNGLFCFQTVDMFLSMYLCMCHRYSPDTLM